MRASSVRARARAPGRARRAPPAPCPQSWLGFAVMLLLVAYHYVTADPKFAEQQKQQ